MKTFFPARMRSAPRTSTPLAKVTPGNASRCAWSAHAVRSDVFNARKTVRICRRGFMAQAYRFFGNLDVGQASQRPRGLRPTELTGSNLRRRPCRRYDAFELASSRGRLLDARV